MAFNGDINGRKKLISDVIDYKMLKDLKVFETVENQLPLGVVYYNFIVMLSVKFKSKRNTFSNEEKTRYME